MTPIEAQVNKHLHTLVITKALSQVTLQPPQLAAGAGAELALGVVHAVSLAVSQLGDAPGVDKTELEQAYILGVLEVFKQLFSMQIHEMSVQ